MQQLWQSLFTNFVKVADSSRETYSITLSPYTGRKIKKDRLRFQGDGLFSLMRQEISAEHTSDNAKLKEGGALS